jgi:hypothetical protein
MPPLSPRIQVEPAKTGFWAGNNSFGNKTLFNPSLMSRQIVGKLPEWAWPQIWTVQLGVQNYPDPGFNGNLFAEIEFGSGGTTDTVEIDWAQGTSISLPMNAANVYVHWDTGPNLTPPNVDLNVDCTFVLGTKRGLPPTRKISKVLVSGPGFSLAANGAMLLMAASGATLALPKYASKFFMAPASFPTRMQYDEVTPTIRLEIENPNGTIADLFPEDYFPHGFVLPALCTKVQIGYTPPPGPGPPSDVALFPYVQIGL